LSLEKKSLIKTDLSIVVYLLLRAKNRTVTATNIGKAIHICSSGIEGLGDGIELGGTVCVGLIGVAVRFV
jgi:hypothetical protein